MFDLINPFNRPSSLLINSVYIGLRDIDAPERRILRENKIKCFSMHDVDAHGIGNVVRMALDHVNPSRDKPIHLSFDVDACDPSVAGSECQYWQEGVSVLTRMRLIWRWITCETGTGTPVRGGLTFREGHYICEAVAETGCLVALDIMVGWKMPRHSTRQKRC